jgi:predicted kinase
MTVRPPLVLTGPPAVGKSVTGRALAEQRPPCAFIDVDDIRQLVVAGGAAPWQGEQGLMQQHLAAVNACALAANFLHRGIEVVIADLLTPDTSRIYREQLPGCRIVRLAVSWPEAQRRARTRRVWLTDDEFRMLHEVDAASPPSADAHLGVDDLTVAEQLTLVDRMWNGIRLS